MSIAPRRPEILAPAGDLDAMRAAVAAGADAVYFGLHGFNARARATNFDEAALGETLRFLHERGTKGYVTLNTLVFDAELASLEAAVRACAAAGVDAVIVQDLVDPVQLPAGAHTIVVGKAGYVSQTKKLTFKAGEKQTVTFMLFKPGPAVAAPPKPCAKFVQHCP